MYGDKAIKLMISDRKSLSVKCQAIADELEELEIGGLIGGHELTQLDAVIGMFRRLARKYGLY